MSGCYDLSVKRCQDQMCNKIRGVRDVRLAVFVQSYNKKTNKENFFITPQAGFEPATRWLTAICSTTELLKIFYQKRLRTGSNRHIVICNHTHQPLCYSTCYIFYDISKKCLIMLSFLRNLIAKIVIKTLFLINLYSTSLTFQTKHSFVEDPKCHIYITLYTPY